MSNVMCLARRVACLEIPLLAPWDGWGAVWMRYGRLVLPRLRHRCTGGLRLRSCSSARHAITLALTDVTSK